MIEEPLVNSLEGEDTDDSTPLRYSIMSYGADYPVDGLVERLKNGEISLPEFQRSFVWNQTQASRFIESLLLGLPVPGIFLFREPASQRLIVVDGHQRLRSLKSFYEDNIRGKRFALTGVVKSLRGLQYSSLSQRHRRVLDNSILHATIFQQLHPSGEKGSVFEVFERLNTTGVPLLQQEIRDCIYRGPFNELLNELNKGDAWRAVYKKDNDRARDKELILRFFAFKHCGSNYSRPMKHFLNRYMESNASPSSEWIDQRRIEFGKVTALAAEWLPSEAFRRGRTIRVNAAITDAMLVGLSRRLDCGAIARESSLESVALQLRDSESFRDVTDRATTAVAAVKARIEQATQVFGEVE